MHKVFRKRVVLKFVEQYRVARTDSIFICLFRRLPLLCFIVSSSLQSVSNRSALHFSDIVCLAAVAMHSFNLFGCLVAVCDSNWGRPCTARVHESLLGNGY